MIFLGVIPLRDAYAAVNLDVVFLLLGMFSVVAAMDLSGFLEYLTIRMLELAKSPPGRRADPVRRGQQRHNPEGRREPGGRASDSWNSQKSGS